MFKVEDATWAVSPAKVARVIEFYKKRNKELYNQGKPEEPITEEVVKALYLRWGGAIVGDPSTFRGSSPQAEQLLEGTEYYQAALKAEKAKAEAQEESEELVESGRKGRSRKAE